MFSFFKKANCIAGVSTTLQSCGMHKEEARMMLEVYPNFFPQILGLTKNVSLQQRNIIAASSYLDLLHSLDSDYSVHLYQKKLTEALNYQIITNNNWREIGMSVNRVRHIINGEKLLSEREVEETFEPSKLIPE